MPSPICELDGAVIVLVGHFNPSIIQPRWLGLKQLIPEAEADQAQIHLIHAELCSFTVGGWLTVEVTPERFQAAAESARAEVVRDFVHGLFCILEHTPIRQVGLNRNMHFRLPASADRLALGQAIVPPGPWQPTLEGPLMLSVTMQGTRPGTSGSKVNVKVEPSGRIPGNSGVFVAVNEHFELGDSAEGSERLRTILAGEWRASLEFAKAAAEHILEAR